jgi:Domain of unknown function (DUF5668)/N-terminal domain of toast_rack, DUF2154
MTGPAPRRGGLRGPELAGLLLIGLGVFFLLDQLGWINFGWGLIWPLIIIGVGVVILAGALGVRGGRSGRGEATVRIPREGTDQLELELRLGAGRFAVRGGSTDLVEAESRTDDIESDVRRAERRTNVRLALDRAWFPFSEHGTPDWRIAVGADVPTRLDVAAGAGDFDFDLSEIRLVDARVSIGAAQARITLPRPIGEIPIRISTGASQVTLIVPQGVEMQVRTSGGLLTVDGPVESPGYATAADRVAVKVDGGAASIRIA